MKKVFSMIVAAIILPLALNAQDLKVISYNIRNSQSKDGTNSWVYRYAASAEMIQDQQADVIGLQEALPDQVEFVEKNFRDYKPAGDTTAIFWNKKTVALQKSGKSAYGTWALIKEKKTGKKFYVFNVDLQNIPAAERKAAVGKMLDEVAVLNADGLPVVVTGGFSMKPSDPGLADIEAKMVNARKNATKTDNTGTFNNWGKNSDIIDHIYYSGFGSCPEYQTVTKRYADRKFVSDHYPLMVLLAF